jgi:uncharacterized iron-regulated membrane protein
MGFVDRPQLVWWRRSLFQIHLWTGIVLALYVVVISLSGSGVVFADRIANADPLSALSKVASRPLPLESLAGIARRFEPGAVVSEVETLHVPENGIFRFQLSRRNGETRYITIDRSGSVVANVSERAPRRALTSFLLQLHVSLLGGRSGALLNGIFGCGLAVLACSGIVLWWPGRANWKRALVIKAGTGLKRTVLDIHSTLGFWSSALVLMFACTGVALAFYGPWTALVARFVPITTAPVAASSWSPGEPIESLDAFIGVAKALEPSLHWDLVELPTSAGDHVTVRLREAGVPLRLARHAFVSLDPRTGAVLQDWRSADRTFGDLVTWYVVEGLHYGDYGTALQYLWVVVGLIPAVLSITSIVLWWNRLMRWRVRLTRRRSARGVAP